MPCGEHASGLHPAPLFQALAALLSVCMVTCGADDPKPHAIFCSVAGLQSGGPNCANTCKGSRKRCQVTSNMPGEHTNHQKAPLARSDMLLNSSTTACMLSWAVYTASNQV